jgi:hypothetical protein
LAPRSIAEVGTAVAFKEKIVKATIKIDLYLVFPRLCIFLLVRTAAVLNKLMVESRLAWFNETGLDSLKAFTLFLFILRV